MKEGLQISKENIPSFDDFYNMPIELKVEDENTILMERKKIELIEEDKTGDKKEAVQNKIKGEKEKKKKEKPKEKEYEDEYEMPIDLYMEQNKVKQDK